MAAQERYRIMIVDDDEDLRALMRSALSSKYEVVEAFDGLDALHKLPDYQPDLAIIDVEMPLMNGLDLCTAIRKHNDFRGIPVLFLSAHGTKEEMKRGYAAGADLFMVKPIEPLRVLKNVDFTIEHDKPPLRRKKYTIQVIHQKESGNHVGRGEAAGSEAPEGDPVLSRPAPPPRTSPPPRQTPPAKPADTPRATTPPEIPRPWVKAPPGQPAEAAPQGRGEAPRPRPDYAGPQRPRVMIVDNEEDARQLMDLALRDLFEITTAHDGLDAIEKLVGYQPDLLLVDVMMPRMNGFHLLQSIRRNPNYQHLPVIIVTARASDRDREYAIRVGANDFLAKPFATEELVRRVTALTATPGFRVGTKKVPIQDIIEREFLIAKERQKDKADVASSDEYKRTVADLKDLMGEESNRLRKK